MIVENPQGIYHNINMKKNILLLACHFIIQIYIPPPYVIFAQVGHPRLLPWQGLTCLFQGLAWHQIENVNGKNNVRSDRDLNLGDLNLLSDVLPTELSGKSNWTQSECHTSSFNNVYM